MTFNFLEYVLFDKFDSEGLFQVTAIFVQNVGEHAGEHLAPLGHLVIKGVLAFNCFHLAQCWSPPMQRHCVAKHFLCNFEI